MEKLKIALLDDHRMFLDSLKKVLEASEGLTVVTTAHNAKSLIKELNDGLPLDLIVTDISMPDMNGIEFIHAAKKIQPNIKILVVSMFDSLVDHENIDGYLTKDSPMEEMLLAIQRIGREHSTYFPKILREEKTIGIKKGNSIFSSREKEIIRLLAKEATNEQIATELQLSVRTVETHRRNINHKLQVKSTAGLVQKALQLGVIGQ